MKQSFIYTILLLFIYSCSGTQHLQNRKAKNHNELAYQIESIFQDSAFAHAHWGASIKSLKTGKVLYEQNANKLFLPASNTKIPTAANTFLELGTDFQFETILYSDATIRDSILMGNLYIKGSGDPTFYEEFYDSTTAVFFDWANVLKSKGIKTIKGDIIGDESVFDESRLGYGWVFDNFDTWYSAEYGPLQINENYVDITIIPPTTSEDSTQIIPNISSSYFSIINKTVLADTGKSSISVQRKHGSNEILISGTLVIGSNKLVRSPSITNPGLFFTMVLKETFERNGISVLGTSSVFSDTLRSDSLLTISDTLLVHLSPDGHSIITKLMKRSQNMYAETMPRFVAYQKTGYGTFEKWLEIIEPNMEMMGIAKDSYQYADGSGLARYNYFSPNQFRSILEYMYFSAFKEQWLEVFPIGGVDGTLKRRMIGTAAENNVRAKTGTISNSRGLSGYVTSKSGEEFVFSFLVNGHLLSSSDTDRITDSILALIADFDR